MTCCPFTDLAKMWPNFSVTPNSPSSLRALSPPGAAARPDQGNITCTARGYGKLKSAVQYATAYLDEFLADGKAARRGQ